MIGLFGLHLAADRHMTEHELARREQSDALTQVRDIYEPRRSASA